MKFVRIWPHFRVLLKKHKSYMSMYRKDSHNCRIFLCCLCTVWYIETYLQTFLLFRFCDTTQIERAECRFAKQAAQGESSSTVVEGTLEPPPEPSRKSCRLSSEASLSQPRPNPHVLPVRCFICKKDKWITNRHTRKRSRERLSNCEYQSGVYV